MKYFLTVTIALLLSACDRPVHIVFKGKAAGINDGVISLNKDGQTVFAENIKNGVIRMNEYLERPGYYELEIADNVKHESKIFDVYMESGEYKIDTHQQDLSAYPTIFSASKIQNELSDYYNLKQSYIRKSQQETKAVKALLDSKAAVAMSAAEYAAQITKLNEGDNKVGEAPPVILAAFINRYPNNRVAAHLMAGMGYESQPRLYAGLFKKLSPEVRASDEGKQIDKKLTLLLKMMPGSPAPEIEGDTPDGKPFDKKAIHKKIILIEFWRASNAMSRINHQKMINGEITSLKDKDFGIISISLDTKRDWWLGSVKDDKLTWTQVSDLKGEDSPNIANWGTGIPNYYLIDGNWRMIASNVNLMGIDTEIEEYLQKHPN